MTHTHTIKSIGWLVCLITIRKERTTTVNKKNYHYYYYTYTKLVELISHNVMAIIQNASFLPFYSVFEFLSFFLSIFYIILWCSYFIWRKKLFIENVEFQQILPKIGYICICRHSQVFSSSVVSAILTHINPMVRIT